MSDWTEDPNGQAALRAAQRREYAAHTQELTDRYDAEIAEMKARHRAERDGLLREIEAAFARLRAAYAEWL